MNETPSRPQGRSTWLVIALIAGVIAIPFFLQPKHSDNVPGAPGSSAPASTSPTLGDKSSTGKVVMLDFYTDWCGYCTKMDQEVYPQANVKKAMESFEFRKINAEQGDDNKALARKYNIEGFPTIVFVDSKGTEVHRIVGYEPAPQFASELNTLSDKLKK
ncbi:MAG TPA: thioredoxin family protein [Armatimonadota bacterium]